MVLPLPGAKVVHVFGQPFQLAKKMPLEEKYLHAMAKALNEMTQRANLLLARP
jgi:hypothetical protein